ncbi:MAG: methyl-accepting chemotaxis protein [Pseudomonadota bacterium]
MSAEPAASSAVAPAPGQNRRSADPLIARLSEIVSPLGYEIVDVSGHLDDIRARNDANVKDLEELVRLTDALKQSASAMGGAAQSASDASASAVAAASRSREAAAAGTAQVGALAGWAQSVGARFETLRDTLGAVEDEAEEISRIAEQVNILAINASIEAVRAGAAGRGFAVVASAITELAQSTAKTTSRVKSNLQALKRQAGEVIAEGREIHGQATEAAEGAKRIDGAFAEIETAVSGIGATASEIAREASQVDEAYAGFTASIGQFETAATATAEALDKSSGRISRLVDVSEELVSLSTELGGARGQDGRFIEEVLRMSAAVSAAFEQGVAEGRIAETALFDQRYRPIPGSNPEQVMAPFTEFTDRVLPPIQEAALAFDQKVVFCAAVDRNGYLPTHNRKFSQPQGADPVWNAANCRNRRIFNDRVGLKAGRNEKRFLLQTYRRDMGGGEFVMMKDLSAPIIVRGRHWGGLRFAYKF